MRALGGEAWFTLGDRDIGLHLVRAAALREGAPLSETFARLAAALDVDVRLLPATDDRLRTQIVTADGELDFQTWFVGRRHADPVLGVRYDGAEAARPAPGVLEAIRDAETVFLAPSNPFVSIQPILAVPGVAEARRASTTERGRDLADRRRPGAARAARGDARRRSATRRARSASRGSTRGSRRRSCSIPRTPHWRPRSRRSAYGLSWRPS